MKNSFVFLVFTLFFGLHLSAQSNTQEIAHADIFETLRAVNSENYAAVKFFQDERIEMLFRKRSFNGLETIYRVQVFSSNVQRTAKSEAYNVEKMLREKFPEHAVFMNYTSPFWRVRIGEFVTRESAQFFRDEIVSAFPKMRNQIYVVPENRNQTNN
jgi:Sporulation related domain.